MPSRFRKWFSRHLWPNLGSTIVALCIMIANCSGHEGIGLSHGLHYNYCVRYGWPLVSYTQWVSEPQPQAELPPPYDKRRISATDHLHVFTIVNIVVGLLMTISTLIVLRLACKEEACFTLRAALLPAVLVLGAMFAIACYEYSIRVDALILVEVIAYYPVSLYPLYISVPLFWGIACMIYTAGWAMLYISNQAINTLIAGTKGWDKRCHSSFL